ncbi:MAG: response regulator transcription factor [Bosea sp.]|uniref:response regulator transcription factor n=1 Tax=unclassified Bosea (in: a-proteobacteria) TaxID=2653178 RepID=UPI00095AC41C|nr:MULTISPECIES: response regulator transcription factor [unclassified Bosea (in: a-proteobacteria)]MBN9459500.1 response regulator transcription factor [Bosea sp. (in: a-proteobacteria)]OJV06146.1 MAG: two-component system response regulator CreB [Bosea sp. 67-29]
MTPRILVVDDDSHIRDVICFALEKAGMATTVAQDGLQALDGFRQRPADLIVLDIGMPEMDGLEVCRQIRKSSEVPILFLSARDDEIDRILGLEIGGDDYVTKPFSPRELVARVNVILKRVRTGRAPARMADGSLSWGALSLDPAAHFVHFNGAELSLTAIEFAILRMLMARPRQVFSREQILGGAYGGAIHVSDRTIDSHIRNIRGKFAKAGCGNAIETVHGVGFRLGQCEASA